MSNSVGARMGCDHREDTLMKAEETPLRLKNVGCIRTKDDGGTPGNQENGKVLRSKSRGGIPISGQVDEGTQ